MEDNKEVKQMKVLQYDKIVRDFPDCPKTVPFSLLDADTAKRNHSQTLDRLNERGGLYPNEMVAVIEKRPFTQMANSDSIKIINKHLSVLATPSPNKAIDLEKLGNEVDAVIANETAESYNKFFGNKAIGESVSEAAGAMISSEPEFAEQKAVYISGAKFGANWQATQSHNEMVKVIKDRIAVIEGNGHTVLTTHAVTELTNILKSIGGKE